MGKKAKTSRKGKKAWRANISTEDIHDFFEKSTKDALSGGSLASAPAESLFFVDKSKDLSVKRKIEKQRDRVLRHESLLQKNPFVKPVSSSIPKKFNKKLKKIPNAKEVLKDESATASDMVDIWDKKGDNHGKVKKVAMPSLIPAVEVDHPGCSFNPSFDSHQDVLASAVAEEMRKVYKKELGPQPVPLTVLGEAINEEDMYFIDADDGSDDDMDPENEGETEDGAAEKRTAKSKKVTQVELNKRARRKEQLKKDAESAKVVNLSREIDSVQDILQEIAKEDEEKHKRHIRRAVAKQERLKSCPPRLGKHRFQPAQTQVLLSEEITGSLRQIKACSNLAKDRYKSLEKRGLIAPRANNGRK
ncbi:ribosome biogenesis protein NOP53 [Humulus lupulus]|uniref:ribosome biogenesis protein NOP53 n=1 Tax=Humulus lupulus TaxID=3486 RepID=UPI002B410D37|nr:ribosome biogenesis protein NOP53 [Humulus lupulus]